MQDLNVVIVGGGAGLGALLARMAVAEGAAGIGIVDLDPRAAEAALAPALNAGVQAAFAACDIRTADAAHAAFEAVAAKLGRVDTLINSAAIYPRRPILEISDADWDASNAINVKGTYHMMVAAIRHMQDQEPRGDVRGRIVNITSVDAFKAHPQNAHYAATKAAINTVTKALGQQLAPKGIRVNAVAPGPIWTPLQPSGGQKPEALPEFGQSTPLGRAGQPTELAPAYVFLASPESSYVVGATIPVTGGMPTP